MAMDKNVPSELREPVKVLGNHMSGIRNPDLFTLSKELAEIVHKDLDEAG